MIAKAESTTTYRYTPARRRTAREIEVDEARRTQSTALVWLVVSIIQLIIFFFGLALPSVQTELASSPELIIPCLPFLIGAVFYITYGYSHDHQKAEDVIQNRHKRN